MTTTTPRSNPQVTRRMFDEANRQHRVSLAHAELAAENATHADYMRNRLGAAYVDAEIARGGLHRAATRAHLVAVLAEHSHVIQAEESRHAAAVARIQGALDAIPPAGGAA